MVYNLKQRCLRGVLMVVYKIIYVKKKQKEPAVPHPTHCRPSAKPTGSRFKPHIKQYLLECYLLPVSFCNIWRKIPRKLVFYIRGCKSTRMILHSKCNFHMQVLTNSVTPCRVAVKHCKAVRYFKC